MGDPTKLSDDARSALMGEALEMQAACLAIFDAAEEGDLGLTVAHLTDLTRRVREVNEAMRPLALLGLLRIERGFGVKFGETGGAS